MARRGVVCGGSWCVDRNELIEHWPDQDTHVAIDREEIQGGGSGANVAVDLKRLGAPFPVEAITLVGDDDDGRFLAGLCTQWGIDAVRCMSRPTCRSSVTYVMSVRPTGRRTFFYKAGTMAAIGPDHFDFAATNAAILHPRLPGTMKTMDEPWRDEPSGWVAVLRKARAAGLKTNIELVTIAAERIGARSGLACRISTSSSSTTMRRGASPGSRRSAMARSTSPACRQAAEGHPRRE